VKKPARIKGTNPQSPLQGFAPFHLQEEHLLSRHALLVAKVLSPIKMFPLFLPDQWKSAAALQCWEEKSLLFSNGFLPTAV